MKVSGFTIARNAVKLGYPIELSLRSLLPLVDELVVAVGDSEDDTWEVVAGIGDFDADGRTDLAVANRSGNSVSILLGNGDGTFQPRTDFAAGPGPISITRADFDRDGALDLAVADVNTSSFGPGRISILLGHGDGTFGSPVPMNAGIRATANCNRPAPASVWP